MFDGFITVTTASRNQGELLPLVRHNVDTCNPNVNVTVIIEKPTSTVEPSGIVASSYCTTFERPNSKLYVRIFAPLVSPTDDCSQPQVNPGTTKRFLLPSLLMYSRFKVWLPHSFSPLLPLNLMYGILSPILSSDSQLTLPVIGSAVVPNVLRLQGSVQQTLRRHPSLLPLPFLSLSSVKFSYTRGFGVSVYTE